MVMWGVGEDEMKGRHGLPTTHTKEIQISFQGPFQSKTSGSIIKMLILPIKNLTFYH